MSLFLNSFLYKQLEHTMNESARRLCGESNEFTLETNVASWHLHFAKDIAEELKNLENDFCRIETGFFYIVGESSILVPACRISVTKNSAADAVLAKTGYLLMAELPNEKVYRIPAEPSVLKEIKLLSADIEICRIRHCSQ